MTTSLSPNAPHPLLSLGKSLSLQFPGSCEKRSATYSTTSVFTLHSSISGLRVDGQVHPQTSGFMYEDLQRCLRCSLVPGCAPFIKRWSLNSSLKDGFGGHHAFVTNSKQYNICNVSCFLDAL